MSTEPVGQLLQRVQRSFDVEEDEAEGRLARLACLPAGQSLLGVVPPNKRRVYHSPYYVKPRDRLWWEHFVKYRMEEVEFFKPFRYLHTPELCFLVAVT